MPCPWIILSELASSGPVETMQRWRRQWAALEELSNAPPFSMKS